MWTRRTFPLIFFGVLALAVIGRSGPLFALLGVLLAGYLVSLLVHPRIRCRHCGGSGELKGGIFKWSFRRCPQCQGGRQVRQGAGYFGLPHVRQQARAFKAAKEKTKTRERW